MKDVYIGKRALVGPRNCAGVPMNEEMDIFDRLLNEAPYGADLAPPIHGVHGGRLPDSLRPYVDSPVLKQYSVEDCMIIAEMSEDELFAKFRYKAGEIRLAALALAALEDTA